jgi:hypothetical protein
MQRNIFKPTIGNKNLHEISNNKGVRVVNFARYRDVVAQSTMFLIAIFVRTTEPLLRETQSVGSCFYRQKMALKYT